MYEIRANQDPVTVEAVHWDRIFPGLLILRSAGMAIRPQILVPALCVTLISSAFSAVFPRPSSGSGLHQSPVMLISLLQDADSLLQHGLMHAPGRLLRFLAHFVLTACFGVIICHAAARSFCRNERTGLSGGLRAGRDHLGPVAVSGLLALTFLLSCRCSLSFMQSAFRWTGIARAMPQFAFASVWLVAAIVVLVAVVVGIGWLLSIAAVAIDRCSGTDALSRGINYTLSRPLQTAFFGILVFCAIAVSSWLLNLLSDHAAQMALSGLPTEVTEISERPDAAAEVGDRSLTVSSIPALTLQAYGFGMFFCGLTITCLLLRKLEDGVDLTECGDTRRSS